MLVAKLDFENKCFHKWFENYVNYAGSKTSVLFVIYKNRFENYVNYAGSKTDNRL